MPRRRLTEHQMALLSALSADGGSSTPSDEKLAESRHLTRLSISEMKRFFRESRTRPRPTGARKGSTGLHLARESAASRLFETDDRAADGKFQRKTNVDHLFTTTQISGQGELKSLMDWGISNAGKKIKCFEGEGATASNSSIRWLEFMKDSSERVEYTHFFKGGDCKYFYETPPEIQDTMITLVKRAEEFLTRFRRDASTPTVFRISLNVMDQKGMGAGKHYDLESTLGTVVVKLSDEESPLEALQIYPTQHNQEGKACPLRSGQAVAFLPGTYHSVPPAQRAVPPRVTLNIFFAGPPPRSALLEPGITATIGSSPIGPSAISTNPSETNLFTAMLQNALARQRMRCTVLTEYDIANMKTYVTGLLPPGWCILFPAIEAGITHLPSKRGLTQNKKEQELAAFLGVTAPVARDRLDGHCETCAVLMASTLVQALFTREGCSPNMPGSCLNNLRDNLTKASFKVQMERIFAAERHVLQSVKEKECDSTVHEDSTAFKARSADDRTRLFWPDITETSSVAERTSNWCAGGPDTQKSFASAAEFVRGARSVIRLPLYVLCYIFDGNELTNADLENTEIESAQYSLHVLGVVLDGRTNTCFVCDPNGYFKPGSGLEYLHLPLQESRNPATTFLSLHDIERQWKPATKRKITA